MTKRELRARIVDLETELADYRMAALTLPPLTFDMLVVNWDKRTVTWKGRLIECPDHAAISFPITNDQYLLDRAGWSAR